MDLSVEGASDALIRREPISAYGARQILPGSLSSVESKLGCESFLLLRSLIPLRAIDNLLQVLFLPSPPSAAAPPVRPLTVNPIHFSCRPPHSMLGV